MKYIVITGASSGIGYEAALLFASQGKNLILVARREKELIALKEKITTEYNNLSVVIKIADLTDTSQVFKLYDELKAYEIETLINNAGKGDISTYHNQDLEKMLNMINLNVTAVAILSSLFVKDYKNVEGSQLINISSLAGYNIYSNTVSYNATKFFVSSLTEGIAKEMNEQGYKLKAKILAPAATETEFAKHSLGVKDFDYNSIVNNFHTAKQMASFLFELYNSSKTVGAVKKSDMSFQLLDPIFPTNILSGQN